MKKNAKSRGKITRHEWKNINFRKCADSVLCVYSYIICSDVQFSVTLMFQFFFACLVSPLFLIYIHIHIWNLHGIYYALFVFPRIMFTNRDKPFLFFTGCFQSFSSVVVGSLELLHILFVYTFAEWLVIHLDIQWDSRCLWLLHFGYCEHIWGGWNSHLVLVNYNNISK